jgi:WD40 repeat protein
MQPRAPGARLDFAGLAKNRDTPALVIPSVTRSRVIGVRLARCVHDAEEAADGENGRKRPVTTLAFSPNGRTLVSGSENGTVLLWDLHAGMKLAANIDAGRTVAVQVHIVQAPVFVGVKEQCPPAT